MIYEQLIYNPNGYEPSTLHVRRAAYQVVLFGYTLAELRAEAKLWEVPRYSRKCKELLIYDLSVKWSNHETRWPILEKDYNEGSQ